MTDTPAGHDADTATRPLHLAGPTSRNRRAALVLVVLTPAVAELSWGLIPLSMAWLVLLFVPIYGAGILVIREAVRRTGRGWPSIVALGVAYELVEDGIGLQALSSPTMYGAADWGPRVLGLNLPYWEANVAYHVLFSAVVPILLTDLLFPSHRRTPYLGRAGLAGAAVVAVAGVGLLRLTVPPVMDPGYTAPLPVLVGCVVAAAVLAVLALGVLPASLPRRPTDTAVPSRPLLAALGGTGTIIVLGLLFPIEAGTQPAFTVGNQVLLPMVAGPVLLAAACALITRWARAAAWSDRHALALAGGALVGHTVFGALVMTRTPLDRTGVLAMAVVEVGLLVLLDRRTATLARRGPS